MKLFVTSLLCGCVLFAAAGCAQNGRVATKPQERQTEERAEEPNDCPDCSDCPDRPDCPDCPDAPLPPEDGIMPYPLPHRHRFDKVRPPRPEFPKIPDVKTPAEF